MDQIIENNERAAQLLEEIKTLIQSCKNKSGSTGVSAEEQRLRLENELLRKEIDELKRELSGAEAKRGLKQIPLPNAASNLPKTGAPVASAEECPKKEQPAKKAKKVKQPQAPAVDEKPVDVSRLAMRVGRILNAKRHPDADSLYVEEVDVGEERNRTIVSGLVKHVPLEQMQNRLAIFLCNLKPAKMRGILSEGMIMCGSSPDKVEIIEVPGGCKPGDLVTVDGYSGEPDELLAPKKKIWEQIQPDLRITPDGAAAYKGVTWKLNGQTCVVPTMRDTPIK